MLSKYNNYAMFLKIQKSLDIIEKQNIGE
jgi:hypothetical protein